MLPMNPLNISACDFDRFPLLIYRLNYDGTNRGDTIYGVKLPSYDSDTTWQLTFGQKKQLFGKHRVSVGGQAPEGSEAESGDGRLRSNSEVFCRCPHLKCNLVRPEILKRLAFSIQEKSLTKINQPNDDDDDDGDDDDDDDDYDFDDAEIDGDDFDDDDDDDMYCDADFF